MLELLNSIKATIAIITLALAGLMGGATTEAPELLIEIPQYQTVIWEKPTTDARWAEDVKIESLHFKFDYQLDEMEQNLTEKLPIVQEDLDKVSQCPDCIKWELKEQGFPKNEIKKEYQSQLAYYKWKTDKLNQSIERIGKEKELREDKKVKRNPKGTTYYIDADCATPGDGTTATCNNDGTDSYDDLDDFTEVARSAGDKAILRRGMTALYDNASDLLFTSDGAITNPIIIEADYDDAWGDFASSSQTYTVTFGSKTMTASAEITDISANDWIYVDGDIAREFAYEIEYATGTGTTTLQLFLPYKGNQSGAGNGVEIMPDAPIWNTAAGSFEVNFDADNFWQVQGLYLRGTDSNGVVEIDSAGGHIFKDMIFEGNDFNDIGILAADDAVTVFVQKSRFYQYSAGMSGQDGAGAFIGAIVKDCLFDTGSYGIRGRSWDLFIVTESEFKNHISSDLFTTADPDQANIIKGRNLVFLSNSIHATHYLAEFSQTLLEDVDGTLGDNRFLAFRNGAGEGTPNLQSTTTTVRSGGGNTSIKVAPHTALSTIWEHTYLQLFEYPIYADTSAKQYDVYFYPDDNTDWTATPNASELWIECEYWKTSGSPNHRKILKSTGTVDMTSDSWQSISVTCEPAQTGILYLRGYYAKTLEATKSNIFYVDVAPVIQ